MTIAETFLPEFEHEMASTRRTIERIPDAKLKWSAHPKSRTIGWVANHLAEIPGWVEGTLNQTVWDLAPEGGEPYKSPELITTAEILMVFDQHVESAKNALQKATDADMMVNWSLAMKGENLFTMPRAAVIRTWVINHTIHHRGILTVYLRLNDIPVPAIYGPSGDEEG